MAKKQTENDTQTSPRTESKKALAKFLYIDCGLTQTDIQDRIKVQQSQISRWATAGNWEVLKSSKQATSREIAIGLQKQIFLLLQAIEERGTHITPSETDTINKLRADIQFFDKSADLPTYSMAFEELMEYTKKQEAYFYKDLADYCYNYLEIKAKELSKL